MKNRVYQFLQKNKGKLTKKKLNKGDATTRDKKGGMFWIGLTQIFNFVIRWFIF